MSNNQHKRSLEDYGFLTGLKRRRHLSPQNSNIDLNSTNDSIVSLRKKTRTKSKNQSILDTSIESNGHMTSRKASSRHQTSSTCQQQMNEIHLPNWECMCPNIDQILSNKHAQSGVFAHEVQLVQQELEALLSMAFVRETILKDLSKPINNDNIRSKIRKHQEAERVYSMKKIPKKKPPAFPANNHSHHHHHHHQNGSHYVLDRQVALAPIEAARIDQIWSNLSTYHYEISSDDISMLENLVEFTENCQTKFAQFKSDYQNQLFDQKQFLDKFQQENYEQLVSMSQINPLVSHYIDRTTLGSFQTKLYEHIGQTSPVYKTPISSPMHGRMLGNHVDFRDAGAALRISPRLHSHQRTGVFSLPNSKIDDDFDSPSTSSSLLMKSKKKSKFLSSPSSAMKFQQRIENVQNYLIDQHLIHSETVKRQLFSDQKSSTMKKRKNSLSIALPSSNHDQHVTDIFQTKLSTIVSLFHECSMISRRALKRARLQADNEEIWLKLNTIEHDLENLIEKLDSTTPGGYTNPATIEKAFLNLEQLVQDWTTYEENFQEQFQELFPFDV